MRQFPKRLKFIRLNGKLWVQSEFTGEIARPHELKVICRMVRDFCIY